MNNLSLIPLFVLTCFIFVYGQDDSSYTLYNGGFLMKWDKLDPNFSFHPLLSNGRPLWNEYITMNWTAFYERDKDFEVIGKKMVLSEQLWTRKIINSMEDGVSSTTVFLRSTFENGAEMEFNVTKYNKLKEIKYGSINFTVTSDFVKLSVLIQKWPFQNLNNYIINDIDYYTAKPTRYSWKEELPSWRYINMTTGHMSMKARFVGFAIIDGEREEPINPMPRFPSNETHLSFSYQTATFNNTFFFDPDFSVLLNSEPQCKELNNCNNHGTCIDDGVCKCDEGWYNSACEIDENGDIVIVDGASGKSGKSDIVTVTIVVVVLAVVAVAVIVVVGFFLFKRRKEKLRKNLMNKLNAQTTTQTQP